MKGFTHTGTFLCKKLDQLSFSSSIYCKCNYYSTFPKIVSIWRSHKTVFYFNTSLFMWLELSLSVRSHTVQNGGRHCFCFDTEPPVCSSLMYEGGGLTGKPYQDVIYPDHGDTVKKRFLSTILKTCMLSL